MKPAPWTHLDRWRIRKAKGLASPLGADYGAFRIPNFIGQKMAVIATSGAESGVDGVGWEHVSVSLVNRCPNWPEMSQVKALFWDEDECVVQFHPPKKLYVNHHPFCLHMWRPIGVLMPTPPTWMVGPREGETQADCEAEMHRSLGTASE